MGQEGRQAERRGSNRGIEPARESAPAPGTRPLRAARRPRWGRPGVGRRETWRKLQRNEQRKECPGPFPRPGHRSTWTRLNATPSGAVPGPGVDGAGVRAGRRRTTPDTMPAAVSAGIETGRECVSSGPANLAKLCDAGSEDTGLSGGHEQRSGDADLPSRRILRKPVVVVQIGVLTNTQYRSRAVISPARNRCTHRRTTNDCSFCTYSPANMRRSGSVQFNMTLIVEKRVSLSMSESGGNSGFESGMTVIRRSAIKFMAGSIAVACTGRLMDIGESRHHSGWPRPNRTQL